MKRWVPGLLATRRLPVLAFGGFALMLAIALALQFQLSRRTWRVYFDDTPIALAIGAIVYSYIVFAWLHFSDSLEARARESVSVPSDWYVGFFAVPSVFALLSAAILLGHGRNDSTIGQRV